jgi:hypothetical protein
MVIALCGFAFESGKPFLMKRSLLVKKQIFLFTLFISLVKAKNLIGNRVESLVHFLSDGFNFFLKQSSHRFQVVSSERYKGLLLPGC